MSQLLVVLGDLSSIDVAIGKARRAFFAFQGKLNPLTGKSIYENCVIPVLLYGCENWILTDANIAALESFGEIGRRILHLILCLSFNSLVYCLTHSLTEAESAE